jgi:hypothetical protein
MAIYYLDVDDEITSAAARIRDSSDSRIALVLSGGSRVATSRINFRLLAGEAKHRNKRLAIIAADPSVQSVARSAELPVYASVAEYEKAEAAVAGATKGVGAGPVAGALDELAMTVGPGAAPARPPTYGASRVPGSEQGGGSARPKRGVPWVVVAGVLMLVIILVSAGTFIFYPSATVVLTLRGETVGPMTVSVKVDPNATATNYQAGTVPGVTRAFPVEASDSYAATGQNVVETAATGTVTFTSIDTLSAVTVITGTQVGTASGIEFTTTSTVSVPKATVSGHTITYGTANAPIQAVVKGTTGNVPADAITKEPADLVAFGVSVTNKAATTGGTHTVTLKVQQSDIDAAEVALEAKLEADFATAWKAPGAVPSGSSLFADSAKLGVATCSPDPVGLVGQVQDSFTLDCQATGTVTMANMSTVNDLVKHRVGASVKTGYSLVDNSVTTKSAAGNLQGSAFVLPVTAQGVQVPTVDVGQLRTAIEGMTVDAAKAYLAQYGQADITLSAAWGSTIPTFDFRIDIQIVTPTGQASAGPAASGSRIGATTAPNGPGPGQTATIAPVQSAPASISPTPSASASASPEASLTPPASPSASPTAS